MEDKKREKIENFIIYLIEKYTWSYLFGRLKYFLNPFTIVKFFISFIHYLKRNILNLLYFFFGFKEKDYMWLYAKKRFFLIKVKHFCILIFISYFGLGYLYDIYARRNWVSLDNFKVINIVKKEFDRRILRELVPIKGRHQQEEPWHYVYYFERFELSHVIDMWIHVLSFVLIINFFFFIFFLKNCAWSCLWGR